jgi:hypothetical protein
MLQKTKRKESSCRKACNSNASPFASDVAVAALNDVAGNIQHRMMMEARPTGCNADRSLSRSCCGVFFFLLLCVFMFFGARFFGFGEVLCCRCNTRPGVGGRVFVYPGKPKKSLHRQRHHSTALLVACIVLLLSNLRLTAHIGFGALGRAVRHVPEDERTGVHVRTGAVGRAPPTADHDLPTRDHDALVSPESPHVNGVVLLPEEFHHGHTLPARDAVLRRQGVEPALHLEVLGVIITVACEVVGGRGEISLLGVRAASCALLCASTRLLLWGLERVEHALEIAVPGVDVVIGGKVQLDGLERAVWVLLAVQFILNHLAVALTRPAVANELDLIAVDKCVAALPMAAKLTPALAELVRPQGRKVRLWEALKERGERLTHSEKVMAPELDVLEQPGHIDALAGVANEDGSGGIVEVDHHLGLVEAELMMPVRVVEAQQERRKNALDCVEERCRRVRNLVGKEVLLAPVGFANDSQKIALLGEIDDMSQVYRLILRFLVVGLVGEGLCIGVRYVSPRKYFEGWPLTNDEVFEQFEGNYLLLTHSDVERQVRHMTHPLKGRVDDVEHSLALLVHALDLDQVDARLGVERAGEAATPKRTAVAFDSVASLSATGHEAHEGLVVEQDGDLLTNLHDEDVSNWSAFRLRLSRSAQAYCKQAQEMCRRVATRRSSCIPRSGFCRSHTAAPWWMRRSWR